MSLYKMTQLVFVYRKWHSLIEKTSMGAIIKYFKNSVGVSNEYRFIRPYRIWKWLAKKANNDKYTSFSAGLEFRSFLKIIRIKKCLVHFLYGEYDMFYAPYFCKIFGVPIVASFHNSPLFLERWIRNPHFLKKLSGIIILGTNQRKYFEKFCPSIPLEFIPHGIDTDFFTPPSELKDFSYPTVLIVGIHLRDFQLIKKFVYLLHNKCPDIIVKCLIKKEFEHFLPKERWLQILFYVTKEELRILYQNSNFLFYAPLDCVASNSVLEALACGLPIISVDVGAVRDYIDEKCGFIIPKEDVNEMVEAAKKIITNPTLRKEKSEAARRKALFFDWRNIKNKFISFYERLGYKILD